LTVIDEIHEIPHPLGITPEEGGVTISNPAGLDADYSIAGVEFLSAASDDFPYQRQLTKQVKDQVDQSDNPGDYSLQGWWLRSQTDWSSGAGQQFMEPIQQDTVGRSYQSSYGVDVFTRPGFFSPTRSGSVEIDTWIGGADPVMVRTPAGFVVASGASVYRYEGDVLTGTATAAGTVTGLTVAGGHVLFCSVNNIERAPLSGTFTATSTFTCTGSPEAWFVKSRVLIAIGDKIHEFPGTAFGASVALTTPLYNLNDTSLSVTGVTTTPRSILLSTKGNAGSVVYALTLDDAGTLPSANAPVAIAEFPNNEVLIDIESYLGTFLGIATNRGVRIATINANGGITYGPLLGSPIPSGTKNVFSSFDRFLHYPTANLGNGVSGLVKVDLSGLSDDGFAPWSTWVPMRAEVTTSCIGGYAIDETHAYLLGTASPCLYRTGTVYESGELTTSLVRFGTLETKMYDSVRVTMENNVGTTRVDTVDASGNETLIGTVSPAMGLEPVLKVKPRKALSSIALKFTLTPSGVNVPVIAAWTLRAYPAVSNRGELVQIPLANFDFEDDAGGVTYGYEGRAWARYKALRDRFAQGTSMLIKELNSGASYLALPEDLQFIQVAPGNKFSGFGGIIQVVLRTLP
jgi:hypothetical protein